MVAHNTGSTVTCSRIKLAYYNLKLYELEIYDLIVAKVALKVYRYRYRHRGKSLFTYRLLRDVKTCERCERCWCKKVTAGVKFWWRMS